MRKSERKKIFLEKEKKGKSESQKEQQIENNAKNYGKTNETCYDLKEKRKKKKEKRKKKKKKEKKKKKK